MLCNCNCMNASASAQQTHTHTISGIEREESDLYPSWSMHEIQFVILHYSTRWSRCLCYKCSSFPQCLFLSDKRCQHTLPVSSPGSCPVFDIRDSASPTLLPRIDTIELCACACTEGELSTGLRALNAQESRIALKFPQLARDGQGNRVSGA